MLNLDLRLLDITAFDSQSGRMAVEFFLSPYGSECGTAMIDLFTGQVTMLNQARYQTSFRGSGMTLLQFDMDAMGYSALYCAGNQEFRFADCTVFQSSSGEVYAVPDSAYLVGTRGGSTTVYALGEQVSACALAESGISGEMYFSCYLPEMGAHAFLCTIHPACKDCDRENGENHQNADTQKAVGNANASHCGGCQQKHHFQNAPAHVDHRKDERTVSLLADGIDVAVLNILCDASGDRQQQRKNHHQADCRNCRFDRAEGCKCAPCHDGGEQQNGRIAADFQNPEDRLAQQLCQRIRQNDSCHCLCPDGQRFQLVYVEKVDQKRAQCKVGAQ